MNTTPKAPLTLIDCVARHAKDPTTFELPPEAERTSLHVGDVAKLIFEVDTPEARHAERMWVRVTGRVDGRYTGILANEPMTTPVHAHVTIGAPVQFEPKHIASITRASPSVRAGRAINDILLGRGIVSVPLVSVPLDRSDIELLRDLANGLRDPACPISGDITSPICDAIDAILADTVTEEHVDRLQALIATPT